MPGGFGVMNFKRFLYFFIFQIFITTFVVSARALEEVKSTDVAVQTQIQNPNQNIFIWWLFLLLELQA